MSTRRISSLRRLLELISPYRLYFYLAIFLTLSVSVIGALRPYVVQYIIDVVYPTQQVARLIFYVVVLLGMLVAGSVLQYAQTYLTNWLSQSIMKNLRDKVFGHILRLRMQFFDRTPVGTLHTRTINDIQTLNDVFSQGLVSIFGELLQLVAIWGMMFYTDVYLTLVVLTILPLLIGVTQIFRLKVKVAFQEVRKRVAELNSFIQEHLTGMAVVQWLGVEQNEYQKFMVINDAHRKENIRTIFYYSVYFPVIELLSALGIALLVWWGTKGVMEHRVSLGVLVAFIMYINMFFRPIRLIADQFNTIQMGIVSAERIFHLLDNQEVIHQDSEVLSEGEAEKIFQAPPKIEFQGVYFEYEPGQPVLRGISFDVPAGSMLAIVGHTGAGKTSIIQLIARFYEFQEGKILIQDVDIRRLPIRALRKHMAMVLQDVFLFSGTILENIRMGDASISEKQVMQACQHIGIHDFIMSLPGQYHYGVGERGSALSAGQKQLIALARVVVFNPKLLILDEATSNIDTESERLIQKAIQKVLAQRTAIIIAHRLSTIQYASQILVLEKGRIIERGTHQTLMQKQGAYFQMQTKNLQELNFS